ncbi:MAG: MerR family transcriptional regulator [Oscillospiraceae bacterium]|nr:MerR family transcriptional regulator [Oscillospiraceae bacterium]
MHETVHISEVCRMLGTTSRTIRYYEQLGLLRTERETPAGARRLNAESIEQLRRILFLRKVGLSLDEITAVCRDHQDAAQLIRSKADSLRSEINALLSRIQLLRMVISAAEQNTDIYAMDLQKESERLDERNLETAEHCTDLLLAEKFTEVQAMLLPELRKRISPEYLETSWHHFRAPCGKFVSIDRRYTEGVFVKTILRYEKKSIVVVMTFSGELLSGLMFDWKEKEEQNDV